MHIRVRLFALQRQQLGRREVPLELPEGATIETAWAALAEAHPVLAPARASMRFACNGEYVDPAAALADGDEASAFRVIMDANPFFSPGEWESMLAAFKQRKKGT